MALVERTVTQMLDAAKVILVPRTTDPTLSGVEQALCQEAINACDRGLNALDGDNLVPQGQRTARHVDLRDKVLSLNTVDQAHDFGTAELYNAMDLIDDAALCILLGLSSWSSDL